MPTVRQFAVGNGPEGADWVPRHRIPRAIGCQIVATPSWWEPGAKLVNTPGCWRPGVDPVKPLVRKRLCRQEAGSSTVIRIHEPRPADP